MQPKGDDVEQKWEKVGKAIAPAIKQAPVMFLFGVFLLIGLLAQQYLYINQIRDLRTDFLKSHETVQGMWSDRISKVAEAISKHTELQIASNANLEAIIREMARLRSDNK